ncbi:hybrid sensor histidine kinase/response regulator transcription factor [Algibacter mikhailovii]|uniref:hybrid sensor histidine kinase/response regulator transcription factor n=1 Tax=Algibacter mikhailovii TaxID=425498 RepID=UPI00249416FB|nr:hybrid sensor histidine kinase/response regulator transcription factor [Algibacter mikhailovii]
MNRIKMTIKRVLPKTLFNKSMVRLIIFLAFCFIHVSATSQNSNHFERITTNNGLSQSDINAIIQDQDGFMWFGTHDGFNRYDGYNFKIFNPDPKKPGAITSNLIYDLEQDLDGNFWIASTGGGLIFMDRSTEKFTTFKHDKNDVNTINSDHVTTVYRDRENRLWIGTSVGLNVLDLNQNKDSLKFKRFSAIEDPFVVNREIRSPISIFQDSKGQIWLGSFSGIYMLSRDSNGNPYFKFMNEIFGFPSFSVRCINEFKDGRLVFGGEKGFYAQSKDKEGLKFEKIIDDISITRILTDNNKIWAGTDNKGLLLIKNNPTNGKFNLSKTFVYDPKDPHSISKNRITSLYKDKTGIIWAGSTGGGINKFDPHRKQFFHVRKTEDPNSLSYDKVRALYADSNDNFWVGTEGGGLNLLKKDPGKNTFEKINSIPSVYAIAEINLGRKKFLLFGGPSLPSLYSIDITDPDKQQKTVPFNDFDTSVFSFLVDSKNTLWIGSYNGGAYRWVYNTQDQTFIKDQFKSDINDPKSISANIIRDIMEDKKGNIWFATANGLSMLSKNEATKKYPKFTAFKNDLNNPNSISHNYILSMYESTNGTLWIGTFGGGLNKIISQNDNETLVFKAYLKSDGLPNQVIKGILEDDEGNLWLSTNKGISKFNPELETFKNYDVNDGLQNNEFQELACLKRKDGEMFFGGINGFNSFYPKNLRDNTFEPETVLTNFSISNVEVPIGLEVNGRVILDKDINETNDIELNYDENNLSFQFSSLHYAAPLKNKFAYKLDGFDTNWKHTSSNIRYASYTNLSPGNYTLLVKASNNDDVWDSTPSSINLYISPPFWLTKMAYVVYSLLFLGLLFGFRKYTLINTNEKHKLELEQLANAQSEELQQSKLEFFTNISHELRTPLTLIKGPLEYLQQSYDSLDRNTIFQQFNVMDKNTDLLLRLVNQILGFRKIEKGKMNLSLFKKDIIQYIKELAEPFQFLGHKNEINFTIESSETELIIWFDFSAIEKIMNNLLSNAFKHTPKKGDITVKLFTKNNHFVIQVDDSGPGIPPDKVKQIFERFYAEKESMQGVGIGLNFTKKLVELHKGNIHVNGSTFTINIPMDETAYQNDAEITLNYNESIYNSMFPSYPETYDSYVQDETIDNALSKPKSKLPVLLVVDDNTDIRNFIAQMLKEDYLIYQAENGKEALELAKSLQPNIIVSDVLMPVMNGFEFCENLKTKPETSHIPIIMLTAKSSDESELEGLKLGADSYIRKPFKIEFLKTKLINIINERENLRKRFNRKIILQPNEVTVTSVDEKFLQQAIAIVEKHMSNTDFNVETLVQEMNFSRSNIYMKFKELTGFSSSEFIRNIRLKRAMQLLQSSGLTVKEIMYMTGFNTGSYFSKCFKKQFGVLPSEYLKNKNE